MWPASLFRTASVSSAQEDGGQFFFHQLALNAVAFEQLDEGVKVEFTPGAPDKGDQEYEHARAINVRLDFGEVRAVDNLVLPGEEVHREGSG